MMPLSLRWLLLPMIAFLAGPAMAGEKALPADLALVPADGVAFVHVRLGDLWRGEFLKDWRHTIDMAGAKSLAAFDSRFFPAPSSLERVTVVLPQLNFEPVVILATSRAIDKQSFLKYTMPDAQARKIKAGPLYVDAGKNLEFFFASDKTLVVGPGGAVQSFLSGPRVAKGNLTEAIQLASSGISAVLGFNVEGVPAPLLKFLLKDVPPPTMAMVGPLLESRLATLSLDLRDEGQIGLRLGFASAKQTAAAANSAAAGIKLARTLIGSVRDEANKKVRGKPIALKDLPETAGALFALGMVNRLDKFLADGPVKKDGNSLLASVKIPQGSQAVFVSTAVTTALLVPAVQKVRAAAARMQSINNLKQIGLAFHSYHDVNQAFPAAAICDKNGKPLLSWRVAILPFIEQAPLYERFKLDEPWDSENNKKLIPLMPKIYEVPIAPAPTGQTHYLVFVGNGAVFDLKKGGRMADITDGTSNTIMCIEANQTATWTKPDDISYDPKKPLPRPANFYGNGTFSAAFCDGSVRSLKGSLSEPTMRALITRAGNEVIGNDFDN